MKRVHESLVKLVAILDELGAVYALVGGLAVSARTQPRFTRDVDVAVTTTCDTQSEQLIHQLMQRGYRCDKVVEQSRVGRLATCRLKSPPAFDGPLVDLIFATSGVEPEIIANSTTVTLQAGIKMPVAQISDLLAMKLLSTAEHRYQDEQDIIELLRVAEADDVEQTRSRLRLITDRGFHRGRSLLEDLDERIARCDWPDGLKNEEFQG